MTDFETHPVGTDDLVKRLRNAAGVDQMEYPYPMLDEAADHIEQLVATVEQLEADADMMFARGVSHGQQVLKDTGRLVIVDSPELVELRETITRADAATAAAYEMAAREVECGCGAGPCQDTANCAAKDAVAIRALATPDQTAALDKLIAEAVKPYAEALRVLISHTHECERELTEALYHADFCGESRPLTDARAILAASKKGGM